MAPGETHRPHCFELTIERYPFDPVGSLEELKGRLKLSQAFKNPELWGKLEPALIRAKKEPEQSEYWKFLEESGPKGDIIIAVHKQVYLTCVDVLQRERSYSLDMTEEAFQSILQDELRESICQLLRRTH